MADVAAAWRIGQFDADAEKLAKAFWPGPLTLVVPKRTDGGVADLALAGLDSVALRIPAHPVARALLTAFGGPVVAPSANRSGHVSPTSAAHVLGDLRGRIDMVIDAGPCAVGVESTIVSCLGEPTLLQDPHVRMQAKFRPRPCPDKDLGQALIEHIGRLRHELHVIRVQVAKERFTHTLHRSLGRGKVREARPAGQGDPDLRTHSACTDVSDSV